MKETASYQEVEALSRWASRVPAFEIESSDPTNTATSVPVNKTINLTMALGIDASTVNSTNVTLTPSVARTVSLHTDGRTIIVDPNTNLAASTLYTVTVTSNVRGRYGSSYVPGVQDTISFTTT
jgi:S-methylmethionine-dependent homocysteine/selenocysteine methylase